MLRLQLGKWALSDKHIRGRWFHSRSAFVLVNRDDQSLGHRDRQIGLVSFLRIVRNAQRY